MMMIYRCAIRYLLGVIIIIFIFKKTPPGLENLASFQASVIATYIAHRDWQWNGGGRSRIKDLRIEHESDARNVLRQ